MPTYDELQTSAQNTWRPFTQPQRPLIKIGISTCSLATGAAATLDALRSALAEPALDADLMITGCWGLCYAEPIVEVRRPGRPAVLYQRITADKVPALIEETVAADGIAEEQALAVLANQPLGNVPPLRSLPFFAPQVRRLTADCGVIDPGQIDHYIARRGYGGLSKALTLSDEAVIKEVLDSGLWGRGGAAFPTGRKWGFLRAAQRTPKYMICNADEGDPGSFVNRNLMESDPHLIIEGMIIGGYATGASRGYIYIREEYPLPVERMELAVRQAREKGLLGADIFASGFSFDLKIVRGAGSYVCGEETGLIASLEDARGMPKIRPPFPAEAGVFGQPTNVNNVESYANVPLILRQGAAWYASQGSAQHKGTKMFSLSGQVQRVGILEVPLGTPMSHVVLEAAGGPPEGRTLKGIQPGGPLSGVIPAADVGIPLEPNHFRERGMLMGSGGLVLLDDSNCIVDLCIYFEWFAEDESCGRCTTCFAGTRRLVEILRRIAAGRGRPSDLELMRLLGDTMLYANCAHGQAAPTVVAALLRFFQDELMEHIDRKRCPARVCRDLVRYEVVHHSDLLPRAAAICPTEAILPENAAEGESASGGTRYRIDQSKCIKCDACREQAPYAIAILDEFGP
ncbi:MAG: NADH-ubiquinone oxidoreductase-F iron-sulfur binding region domain-containing protein [Dehalococcoidia bacterium]